MTEEELPEVLHLRQALPSERIDPAVQEIQHPRASLVGSQFMTQTGADRGVKAFAPWQVQLAPILVDGAADHAETIVPEIANLAGDEQRIIVAAGTGYPPVFINR